MIVIEPPTDMSNSKHEEGVLESTSLKNMIKITFIRVSVIFPNNKLFGLSKTHSILRLFLTEFDIKQLLLISLFLA